jgi:hypothetical protein
MRAVAVCAIVLAASGARADAPEPAEQSPEGVATAGAQTADADAPAALFYDPAAMTFQRGLTVQAGGAAIVDSDPGSGARALGVPAIFASQRVSERYAVGLALDEALAWRRPAPSGLDWRGYDVTVAAAVRPRRWLALGLALDLVPTTVADTVGAERLAASGTGLGGHASLLVRALPRWLELALAYRSAVELPLAGTVTAPGAAPLHASGTQLTAHQLTLGIASHPLPGLTLTTDVRLALWSALPSLALLLGDGAGQPRGTFVDALALRDVAGVRAGAAYRFWRRGDGEPRLVARVGAGWEQAPAPPYGDRGIVAAGFGARVWRLALDVAYAATVARAPSGGDAVTHVVSAAVTLRLPSLGGRLAADD